MGNVRSIKAKVTIKDIAKEAGVSPALVSFVMKNAASGTRTYRVNEETSLHILNVASKLNYHPNLAARTLKSGKSNIIGVIISDLTSPFFAEITKRIEYEAYLQGYSVLIGSTEEDAGKLRRIKDVFINRGVDGLVIVPCENSDDIVRDSSTGTVPVVLLDRDIEGYNGPSVLLDNYQAFNDLTSALLNRGYKRVEMVTYSMNLSILPDRERGYEDRMRVASLQDNIRFHRIDRKSDGHQMAEAIISAHERGVEALVFATNALALKGMKEMYMDGINKDFGIACFGHNDAFDIFDNEVIYAKQPTELFARSVMDRILSLINGEVIPESSKRVILRSEIID